MKKTAFIWLAFFMLFAVGCQKEQPTIYSLPDKYTIQEDTNWVEITDIDTVDVCFGPSYWNYKGMVDHQIILHSENEYKAIFDDAVATTGREFHLTNCDTTYKPTGVNFSERIMVLYSLTGGDYEFSRKIYYNKNLNKYLHLTTVKFLSYNKIMRGFFDNISLPRYNDSIKIVFDTLHINFP